MTLAEKIFVFSFLAIMIASLVRRLPRHWTGQTKATDLDALRVWGISSSLRLAFRRVTPVVGIALTSALAALAVVAITGGVNASRVGRILVIALITISLLCGIIFQMLIVLFNWPKFVVAPPFRS